jgi:hypothetical protein
VDEWRPKCMTPEEYDDWHGAAVRAAQIAGGYMTSVCDDCTYQFRLQSIIEGVCNNGSRRVMNMETRRARIRELRAQGISWGAIGLRLDITARQAMDSVRERAA